MDGDDVGNQIPSSSGSIRNTTGHSSFREAASPNLDRRIKNSRLYQSTRDLSYITNNSSRSSSNSLHSSRTHSNNNISTYSNTTAIRSPRNDLYLNRNSYSFQTLHDQNIVKNTFENQLTHNEPESDHYLYARGAKTTHKFRSIVHSNHILGKFCELRNDNLLCDVILELEGNRKFPAHRCVLASASPYFYIMFTGPLSESRSAEIFLHDINAEAFEEILSFMYTGELLITEDNVQTLLPVANHLQMTTVKEACCEFLQSKVLPTNCLGIQRFADIHACPQLFKFTKKFTQQHFTEVLEQGEEYLDLTVEQLIEILDSDDLCVSEENIFHAVTRWIRQEPDTRSKHAAELFSRVRFALHPKEELLSLSQSENFLRENPWCKDYLIEALSFHLLTWEQKKVMDTIRSKPRTAFSIPKSLVVIGGQAPKAVKWVQTFNFTHNSWATNSHSSLTNLGASSSNMGSHLNESLDPNQNEQAAPSASQKNFFHFPDLPARRSRFGVTTIGNKIYAVGGFNGALRLRSMEIFDIHKQTWQSGTNMEVRRSTLGVTSLNGKVYAIGGFDGVNGFKSAETYDPSAEQWTQIANMSVRRSSVCCTEMNEKIYAIGGYDGIFRRCLSSVERYDPKSNKWSSIPDMTTRRSGACAVSISGKIYVVGGHDGPLVWNTCETFSEETGTWQKLADLNVSRRNAGAVVYQDRIFIVGGDDGNTNLTSVEYYDPNENVWRLLPCQMPHGVCYAGVVLMTSPFFF